MEVLVENRNIIIFFMMLIIGYLLYNTDFIQDLIQHIRLQWSTMNNLNRIIVVIIVLTFAYRLWNSD